MEALIHEEDSLWTESDGRFPLLFNAGFLFSPPVELQFILAANQVFSCTYVMLHVAHLMKD